MAPKKSRSSTGGSIQAPLYSPPPHSSSSTASPQPPPPPTTTTNLSPVEIKPQKACVLCRRSKVKCIHDGAPPCKRCRDTNQQSQCKFRLRADDETWRERTDQVLEKLGQSVEWLVQQQQQQQQQEQHSRLDSYGSTGASTSFAPSPTKTEAATPAPLTGRKASQAPAAPAALGPPSYPASSANLRQPQQQPTPPAPPHRPSSTTYLGFDGAGGLLSPGPNDPALRPSAVLPASVSPLPSSLASTSALPPLQMRASPSSALPPPPPAIPPLATPFSTSNPAPYRLFRSSSTSTASQSQPFQPYSPSSLQSRQSIQPPLQPQHRYHSSSLPPSNAAILPPPMQSSASNQQSHYRSRSSQSFCPPPLPLEPGQTRPSSIIHSVHRPFSRPSQERPRPTPSLPPSSTTRSSPYATPSHYIGRNDPRLTVISMGLTSMDQARHLFKFFARYLQPHCFGFPAYPANENMTPLIIACILMVSSMHEPTSRHLFDRFRHEAFSSPLLLDQPIDPSTPLDPELGIGVEEITGACIAACWLGGSTAYKIARIARYWTIGYLEHFEVRSAQTLGEWMTILPPFRQIDLVEKLRIWLMSYVTEAQQAVLNNRPILYPDANPAHYCDGLLNASLNHHRATGDAGANSSYKDSGSPAATSTAEGGGIGSFASDKQLVAHARMMNIILAGQEIQRSARAAIAAAKASHLNPSATGTGSGTREAVIHEATQMVERWRDWLEELNHWRLLTSQYTDLSEANTPEAVDLSLLYHLSRTFLASHPMDPELDLLDVTREAIRTAATVSSSINEGASSSDSGSSNNQHQGNIEYLNSSESRSKRRLAIAQLRTISTAKHSAISALKLAISKDEYCEKLSYLPQFYQFLLGHAAGLLLLLVEHRHVFLMAKEAQDILQLVESFIQLYVYRISSHGFYSSVNPFQPQSRPYADARATKRPKHHHNNSSRGSSCHSGQNSDVEGDDRDFDVDTKADVGGGRRRSEAMDASTSSQAQDTRTPGLQNQYPWPFWSNTTAATATTASSYGGTPASNTGPTPTTNTSTTTNEGGATAHQNTNMTLDNECNPADKHPASSIAQSLARALYHVKLQFQA